MIHFEISSSHSAADRTEENDKNCYNNIFLIIICFKNRLRHHGGGDRIPHHINGLYSIRQKKDNSKNVQVDSSDKLPEQPIYMDKGLKMH